ncbi:hypothetical protein EJB05_03116, partial [Eragrostis curvula]
MHGLRHKRLLSRPSPTGGSSQRATADSGNSQRSNANRADSQRVSAGGVNSQRSNVNPAGSQRVNADDVNPQRSNGNPADSQRVSADCVNSQRSSANHVNQRVDAVGVGSQMSSGEEDSNDGAIAATGVSVDPPKRGRKKGSTTKLRVAPSAGKSLFTVSRQHRRKAECNLDSYLRKRVSDMLHQARLDAVKKHANVVEENELLRERNESLLEENGVNRELILTFYADFGKDPPTHLLDRLARIDAGRHQWTSRPDDMHNTDNDSDESNDESNDDLHSADGRGNGMHGEEGSSDMDGEVNCGGQDMEE